MFDEINVIGDMLRDFEMEEKALNPSTITNKHTDIDEVPARKPIKKPTVNPKTKSYVAMQPRSDDLANNLSTETIIEMKTETGTAKNVLGLLDTGALGKVGAFVK
eukprot:9754945-Ditylum_brightwellii.AAC.1